MDEQDDICTQSSNNNHNCSFETTTQINSVSGIECEQVEQSEMDLQCSLISDKSISDISPIMDVENISHSGSLADLELIPSNENNSETVLEITEIVDAASDSINIELLSDQPSIFIDDIPKDEVQYNFDSPSISVDTEFHTNTASKPSTNVDLNISTDPKSDNDATSESFPGLEIIPSNSKEESTNNTKVEILNVSSNHSNEFTSTVHIHDNQDDETSSPYEVYARHMFNTPVPPPRHKKKLQLMHPLTMDAEEPEMDVAPKSKRLCRYEDLQPSDLETGEPTLDISTSMETAILVEDIPPMDKTFCIDASLTMDTGNTISPAPSHESISDIESLPETPNCFTSTQRPLMLPNLENISINE